MDHRYPYNRRLIERARRQRRAAAVALLGVALCTAAFALMWQPGQVAASLPGASIGLLAPASAPTAAERAAPRRIYPYSVVPGGVSGQAELARIVRTDKVVAAHYATFDVARARPLTVARPRAVHVSYRKGDKVYWTAKKIMLAEGETLLSDGTHEMRARCANRISDVAQFPVEEHAPSADVLDSVEDAGKGKLAGSNALSMASGGGWRPASRGQVATPNGLGASTAGASEDAGARSGSARARMGGMQGMSLAHTTSSRSMGSAAATPAAPGTPPAPDAPPEPSQESVPDSPAIPALPDPGARTPPLPAGGGADSTPPITPPEAIPDPRPPGTGGGTNGGGGSAGQPPGSPVPGQSSPESDPAPFLPEPGLAPPALSTDSGGDKPDPATVPEPGTLHLGAAALACLLGARRQGRGQPWRAQDGIVKPRATAGRWRNASSAASTRG